ncbi:hybrid sensor histidine kinase/response regulator [Sphingobacterium sp. UBA5670]|uniref:hybrid sensor histidine kinase/response regulator n=1 Tax=Sphingobacterium sp. UBA5670 TaxID=1947502 RepID=UPI0025CD1503|nr:ATP-binding protein [Sphingobacterium sp. UBA5670]
MILIVDDQEENIFSLKKLLESKNFLVDTAFSGEEALKKALKGEYVLIILDVQMPDMDGFEVAATLRGLNKTKNIPIIFLSAVNKDKKFITQGYAAGGHDYVTKPVDPEILLLKVKTFYELHEKTVALNKMQQQLLVEIEERKRAQRGLEKQINLLHQTLESLPQLAFTANFDGDIKFVNSQWFNFVQAADSFPSTHPEETEIKELWHEVVSNKDLYEKEVRIKEHDSENYRYHLLRISPIREQESGPFWVGTFTDIDHQKQLEQKKDEFLSIASHELKTPLTSIKGYVQFLLRLIKLNDLNSIEKHLLTLDGHVDKLQELIKDLLDISKIENGHLNLQIENFDIENLIEETVDSMKKINNDVMFELRLQPNRRAVQGDKKRIEQVLVNYLSNGIKYSVSEPRIVIDTLYEGDQVSVLVTDYGIGIPQSKQQHVFDKFYRVEESSLNFQGLGIGLYICSEIIRQHNGSVGVRSAPTGGSTFYFSLPLN